jgi:sporulation protein YlmC with PRC-barrel domain
MSRAFRWEAALVALTLVSGTVWAQDSSPNPESNWTQSQTSGQSSTWGQNEQGGQPSQSAGDQNWEQSQRGMLSGTQGQRSKFLNTKSLLGEEVTNQRGQLLGAIKDIMFNPEQKQVIALVSIGNGQNALVPVQALHFNPAQGNFEVSMKARPQDLQNSFIVPDGQALQALNSPGFTRRLYSQYTQTPSQEEVIIIAPVPQGRGGANGTFSGGGQGMQGQGGSQGQEFQQSGQGGSQ